MHAATARVACRPGLSCRSTAHGLVAALCLSSRAPTDRNDDTFTDLVYDHCKYLSRQNAAVAQEDTSQHGEIAEEPPDAVSEEKVDSTGTVMEAAQAISEDVAVTTEGETAEGSPPAVLDRGRDISILDAEMPHAAADDSVTAAVVEGDIPEVLLRAVAQETQDEATLLIAEGEPSGVVENEAVMVATEDQPANEGVSEQLPQIQETTRMSEDDLPIPKQEDESITPGVSDAPIADIASDTSVEAAPEVKGKAAAVSEVSSVVRWVQVRGASCHSRWIQDRVKQLFSNRSLTFHIHSVRTHSRINLPTPCASFSRAFPHKLCSRSCTCPTRNQPCPSGRHDDACTFLCVRSFQTSLAAGCP